MQAIIFLEMAMNKSDATEMENEIGSQIVLIVGRVPKKNHDAALQIHKQFSDLFRKYGAALGDIPTQQYQVLRGYGPYQHSQYCLSQPRRRGLGQVTIPHRSQAHG